MVFDGSRYYVSPASEPHVVQSYDETGRPLDRLDRGGRGPGELGLVSALVADEHGIWIVDEVNGRLVRLSRSLEYRHSRPFRFRPVPGSTVALDREHRMAFATSAALHPEAEGSSILVVDTLGTITATLGPLSTSSTSEDHWTVLAHDPSGESLVSGGVFDHRLRSWNVRTGEPRTLLVEPPAWFRPVRESSRDRRQTESGPRAARPPVAKLRDITIDSMGRLWSASQLPRPGFVLPDPSEPLPPAQEIVSSRVEVRSGRTGAVRGHCTADGFVQSFVGKGKFLLYRETALGEPRLSIFRTIITGSSLQGTEAGV
jgi:hypothetical protein